MSNPRMERSYTMRSGRLVGGLLTSLAVAAAATLAVIELWGRSIGLVVGGGALAAIVIVTAVAQQRRLLRRAEARLLRAHVRRLDRGRLPRVGGPREATGGRSVWAPVAPRLAEALRLRWFVVVAGDHATGAAADAMRAVLPQRRLLVPVDGHSLATLLAEIDLSGTVVWLGDLDEFVRRDGAAASLIDRLATVSDLTVMATRLAAGPAGSPELAEVLRHATVIAVTEPDLPGVTDDPFAQPAPPVGGRPGRAGRRVARFSALAAVAAGFAADASPGPPACGFPAEVRVVTSVELRPIVRELVTLFRHEADQGGCQQANVQVEATVSGGATIDALGRGWSRNDQRDLTFAPDVVIQDSSVDIERVQLAWSRSQSRDVTLVNGGSLALSPIVLAAPRSALPRLAEAGIIARGDGTATTFRWRDLVAASQEIGIARASPRTSSAGFAATLALYRQALELGPDAGLDQPRLQASGAELRKVELGVQTQHEETSGLLCALRKARTRAPAAPSTDPPDTRLTLPLVAERSVVDYNDGRPLGGECAASTGPANDPLVPLIATEGTPVLDYPVVRVDWARPPRSRQRHEMTDRFIAFLHRGTAQVRLSGKGFRDHNLRSDNDHIPGDRPARMVLPAGPQINDLLAAWEQARRPARMLMAVDVSRAMGTPTRGSAGNQLDAAVAAITNSLRFVGDFDEVGLWASAQGSGEQGYRELVPIGPAGAEVGSGKRKRVLIEHLARLRAQPVEPAIGLTLPAGINRLRSRDPVGSEAQAGVNTVLVLFTADGARTADISQSLQSGRRVTIFLIVFGADGCDTALAPSIGAAVLDSGGKCFTVESANDVNRAMEGLAAALWSGQQ
jgi:Bacterial extracellular solute-binding protein